MTSTGSDISLRSLRDRPFELLKELEKRSRAVAASNAPEAEKGQEWVGVAFRMAGELYLAAREETREVLGLPAPITRVPGAKSWIKGLANVRGQLLPVLDLRQYLGSGATQSGRNTRVLVRRIAVSNYRHVPIPRAYALLCEDLAAAVDEMADELASGEMATGVRRSLLRIGEAFERRAGEIHKIRGHQRQNAGR